MGRKVLLAEDSLTIQKVFELAFRGSDIALTTVDNGEDAIRLAAEIAPDLVVADVTLPAKDGFEVATALSGSGRSKAVPVLVLSGTLAPFDEEKFRKSGASGVLFKPFESQELFEKIETILRGGEPPRGAEEAKAGAKRPAAEETWDFTDVIEEAEREAAAAQEAVKPAAAPLPRGAELLTGLTSPAPKGEGQASLGEFDVSLDEIEAPSKEVLAGPAAPLTEVVSSFDEAVAERAVPPEEGAGEPPHITGDLFQDAPPAVTDLTAALDSVEELEDIEVRDEMALLEEEVAARAKAGPPEAAREPSPPPEPEIRRPASFQAATKAEPAAPEAAQPPSRAADETRPGVPPAAPGEFSDRAREIFEKVAAEAVERAMWDVMERLSGEFSAKVREAVETVAWEV
ncbi:MAG: response regulator, partial [Gemmatimonadota bacterium]